MSLIQYDERARDIGVARWITLMAPAAELARTVASTEFVPGALRHNPAAITAAILYGDEVGLGPMQSLARVHMVDGRPTLAAETMRGLILARGHEIWVEHADTQRAVVAGQRAGTDHVTRVEWTMDDARRARIDQRNNWRAYPRAMLVARATAELARFRFADVIGGLMATEELDDEAHAPHLDGNETEPKAKRTRKREDAPPALAVAPVTVEGEAREAAEELPPLPGDEDPPPARLITDAQRRKLHALFRERGVTDRTKRLEYATGVIGRAVESSSDLTVDEASRVIDDLASWDAEPNEDPRP